MPKPCEVVAVPDGSMSTQSTQVPGGSPPAQAGGFHRGSVMATGEA